MATQNDGSCIQNPSSELRTVKILILGEIGIGKTTFIETYIGTHRASLKTNGVFQLYRIGIKYKGNVARLNLFDLYPGPNCPERRACYPADVNAILLCFSIGHHDTLKCVFNQWIYEVRVHFGRNVPIFLVGLRSDVRLVAQDGVVEKGEAENIHKKHHFHGEYMECSMNDRDSVADVIKKAFAVAMGH